MHLANWQMRKSKLIFHGASAHNTHLCVYMQNVCYMLDVVHISFDKRDSKMKKKNGELNNKYTNSAVAGSNWCCSSSNTVIRHCVYTASATAISRPSRRRRRLPSPYFTTVLVHNMQIMTFVGPTTPNDKQYLINKLHTQLVCTRAKIRFTHSRSHFLCFRHGIVYGH